MKRVTELKMLLGQKLIDCIIGFDSIFLKFENDLYVALSDNCGVFSTEEKLQEYEFESFGLIASDEHKAFLKEEEERKRIEAEERKRISVKYSEECEKRERKELDRLKKKYE